jgi:hypothetical protein
MTLTERDRAILTFERTWWTLDVSKDVAILEKFDLSTERYHQILAELIDLPEALDADPLVVRRLQRDRERRHRARHDATIAEQRS